MIARAIGTFLLLACASSAALAQDHKSSRAVPAKLVRIAAIADDGAANETINAGIARLAVRGASTAEPPTQQELLAVILLMSLRSNGGRST